jgi:hypothetical protein
MSEANYVPVAAALPAELPAISRLEARRIATKIMRKFWPKSGIWNGYVYPADGVRRVWLSPKPTTARNHDKGLGRLIHDLSHDVFTAHYPRKLPHDPLHARYETDIAAFVASSGWLKRVCTPKRDKPKPTVDEKRAARARRCAVLLARWRSKEKRARTAIRKYERALKRLAA